MISLIFFERFLPKTWTGSRVYGSKPMTQAAVAGVILPEKEDVLLQETNLGSNNGSTKRLLVIFFGVLTLIAVGLGLWFAVRTKSVDPEASTPVGSSLENQNPTPTHSAQEPDPTERQAISGESQTPPEAGAAVEGESKPIGEDGADKSPDKDGSKNASAEGRRAAKITGRASKKRGAAQKPEKKEATIGFELRSSNRNAYEGAYMDESRRTKFEMLLQETRDEISRIESHIEQELAEVKERIANLHNEKKAQLAIFGGYCQLLGLPNEYEEEAEQEDGS